MNKMWNGLYPVAAVAAVGEIQRKRIYWRSRHRWEALK
jgi:hypothetical protein